MDLLTRYLLEVNRQVYVPDILPPPPEEAHSNRLEYCMDPRAGWNAANRRIILLLRWHFRNNLCFVAIVLRLLSVYGSIFIIYISLFKFVLLSNFLFPFIEEMWAIAPTGS